MITGFHSCVGSVILNTTLNLSLFSYLKILTVFRRGQILETLRWTFFSPQCTGRKAGVETEVN